MKPGIREALLLGFACVLSACASGHCRARNDVRPITKFVYKPDGSKQCGVASAVPVQQMGEELSGIKIITQENRSDGKMYPMVCGAPTGKINVYEIPEKDFDKAVAAGFKEFKK